MIITHQPHDHDHEHHHHEHEGRDHPGRQAHSSRSFSEIRELIQGSELSDFVKQHATSIFGRIGKAESKIHGASIEEVQFHEVGALDSIVDVVLSCVGLEALQVARIYFSSLVDGQGTFRSSHGEYPLPGPATLEILQDIPIRQVDIPFELITPTGAAIVAEFHHAVGALPEMRPSKIGYGLGTRDLPGRPNVLRAILGNLEETPSGERIVELQTNIDDLSPEILGAVQDRLFQAGALDVFFTPDPDEKKPAGDDAFGALPTFGTRKNPGINLRRNIHLWNPFPGTAAENSGPRIGRGEDVSRSNPSQDRPSSGPDPPGCARVRVLLRGRSTQPSPVEANLRTRGGSVLEFRFCFRAEYFSSPRKSS